jgi:hypothetical protein
MSLHVLLEDDLDCDLLSIDVCFTDNAVRSCA